MSFQSKDLSVLAYANGFTLWHYTTVDLATDVDTSGYFDDAYDLVYTGDMIMFNVDIDGKSDSGIFLINSVLETGGSNYGGPELVSVTNMTAPKR